MHSGRYTDGRATPGGAAFNIEAGERSNFDQYRTAIATACRSIYIEHQHIEVAEIIDHLQRALRRGVEIVAIMPAEQKISTDLSALAQYENCTLAGIAGLGADNKRKPVWVHAKLMIVDDV
jgi:phosphatidylserine/phosphatidylglycerophosphate/cardiolipin synthase-like enzyme